MLVKAELVLEKHVGLSVSTVQTCNTMSQHNIRLAEASPPIGRLLRCTGRHVAAGRAVGAMHLVQYTVRTSPYFFLLCL